MIIKRRMTMIKMCRCLWEGLNNSKNNSNFEHFFVCLLSTIRMFNIFCLVLIIVTFIYILLCLNIFGISCFERNKLSLSCCCKKYVVTLATIYCRHKTKPIHAGPTLNYSLIKVFLLIKLNLTSSVVTKITIYLYFSFN